MRIYTGKNVSLKIEGLKLEGVTRAEHFKHNSTQ